jgi:hypothetical protein
MLGVHQCGVGDAEGAVAPFLFFLRFHSNLWSRNFVKPCKYRVRGTVQVMRTLARTSKKT